MALLRLEAFENEAGDGGPPAESPEVQQQRLEAYENGYQNGWDDAANAQVTQQNSMTAELARNLQTLNFTYQEARVHMLKSLLPLMEAVVGKILPAIAQEALLPAIVEVLMPLAEQAADAPVVILLRPQDRTAVEEFLAAACPGLPVTLHDEPALPAAQAILRLGEEEVKLDLGEAATRIATLVRDFFSAGGDVTNG